MEIVIILVIVGGVIWAIVSGINGRQEVKELGEIMKIKVNNLSNFNATQKVVGVNNLYTFAVDNYCCPIKVRSSIDSIKIGGQT